MPYESTKDGKGFKLSIKWEGFDEFDDLMKEIQDDFSEKDQKAILRLSMRKAMSPVLTSAKNLLTSHGSVDTGQLLASLQVEARKPNGRDRRSSYVTPTDIMIARVTVPSGNILAKKKFQNLRNTKSKIKQLGMISDARAFAVEFGYHDRGKNYHAPRPFLRPALEGNIQTVLSLLTTELGNTLNRYKSKYAK
jgi:hypothetical protein